MSREHRQTSEVEWSGVHAYAATFIPRFDMYPVQLRDGRYATRKQPLNPDLITAHLKGTVTLGAYALDQENRARWICLDADTDETWRGLLGLAADLQTQDVVAYIETSRRGGHLWLFTPLLPGRQARQFGGQLLAEQNLEGIELYPKQAELKTGPGSLVRLPLGRHRLTGRRYHFVTLAGEPLAPTVHEQVLLLASPVRVSQDFIDRVLEHAPPPATVSPTPEFMPSAGAVTGETLSERLKRRISVYNFVSLYVKLDEQGRGYCPFHPDEHKSFGVNASKNFWHCFAGCGGGSLIDFWQRWREKNGEDAGFVPTITELAGMLL